MSKVLDCGVCFRGVSERAETLRQVQVATGGPSRRREDEKRRGKNYNREEFRLFLENEEEKHTPDG